MSALEKKSNKADTAATRAEVRPLYVVKLDDTHAALVTQVLPVGDDGAYGSCSALDTPKAEKPEDDVDQGPHECVDIRSTWRFQDNCLLVAFEGRLSQLDKSDQLQPTQKIRQQAVYEATPGKLTLVSGSNPIPGF